MKTLTVILLIAANSLLAAPPTPPASVTKSPTPAPILTYSGNCNPTGQGPVIKASPGTILTIHAGASANNVWLLLFNKTTAPVNGDVPALAIPFQLNQPYSIESADRDYPGGFPMTTGISWALSQTPSMLTFGGCKDITLTVTYR